MLGFLIKKIFRLGFVLFLSTFILISCGVGGGGDADTKPFITTWKTDNTGATANNQIKVSTTGVNFNYSIDWGDNQTDNNVTGDIIHTYATAGTYTVKINGDFPHIFFGTNSDAEKLLSIEQWGTIKWRSMGGAFQGCINFVGNAIDVPDLSQVTYMGGMFNGASNFNQDISNWDVSSVTNMHSMFIAASTFNQDLSAWNVSSVTNMDTMFALASAFNQDLSDWNVSSVTDMSYMFYAATTFNQDISSWNVSSVTDMRNMFAFASVFNQDLSDWTVSSVTDMASMFNRANAFNQDISLWDVSSVTDMSTMFAGFAGVTATTFNQDLSMWNVSSVTDMHRMFHGATAFNQDLGSWDVSLVTDMNLMFDTVTLSTGNYDSLLLGWSARSLQSDVTFSGGNSQYSNEVQAARDILTDGFGWIVTDGGVAQ